MALDGLVYELQEFGPVAPSTLTQPVRFPEVKFGDGIGVEEGTTNLVTNPSFETGTVGWSTSAAAVSTDRAFVGTQSMKVTANGGTYPQTGFTFASTLATSTTYTASAYLYRPAGGMAPSLLVSGAGVTAGSSSAPVTATGVWERRSVTFTTAATAGVVNIVVTENSGNAVPAGQVFYVDAVQVEAKAYATSYTDGSRGAGYSWTGAEHGSTSVRATGAVFHAAPITATTNVTVCAWVRVGLQSTARTIATLIKDNDPTQRAQLFMSNTTTVGLINNSGINQPVTTNHAPGDLVFAALSHASGVSTVTYASKNGAALLSSAGTSAAGGLTGLTRMYVSGSSFSNEEFGGGVEQVLVFAAALTATEVAALAFGGAKDYSDDSRIVYAAATPSTRGTANALTAAGKGRYRPVRSLSATLDDITAWDVAGKPAGATHKVTIPSGSGVGEGTLVSFRPDGLTDRYRVLRSSSGLGADELFVIPA